MAINFDPNQAAGAALPGRLDRHEAQARQDRWACELERAMLSSSAKKGRETEPDSARSAPQEGQRTAMPGMARSAALTQGQADSMPRTAAEPEHASAAPRAQRHAQAQLAADSPQSAPHVPDQAAEHDSAARAAGGAPLGHAHPGAVSAAAPLQTHARNGATGVGVPAIMPAAFSLLGAAAPGQADGAPGGAERSAAARMPADRSVLAGAGTVAESAEMAESAELAELAEESAGGQAGATELGEVPEFDKRLMHLYVDGDAVHAFIRDADLGAAQARAVALAMAAQVAANGQSLAALTVNGKAVDARAQLSGAADELFSLPGGERDAPAPFAHLHPSVRKGNF